MPSLVYETSEGKVAGFLGVLPLQMKFEGKIIWAGIGGNYMVDSELKNPLAGPRILKKFLSGPQSLSMSDTGNDIGRKMWEGLGGGVSYNQSLHWIRPLRPIQLTSTITKEKATLLRLAGILVQSFGRIFDRLSATWQSCPLHLGNPTGYVKEITLQEIQDSIQIASSKRTLAPAYSGDVLQWILQKAHEKSEFGPLRTMGVYTQEHSLTGWFLYYPNPGKIGQVLQVGSRCSTISNVLDHLFRDAYEMKSLGLIGRMEPVFIKEFSTKFCLFFHRSHYFVMHAKNAGILHAINSGDAYLTRLEGEWWTRLQGDSFN